MGSSPRKIWTLPSRSRERVNSHSIKLKKSSQTTLTTRRSATQSHAETKEVFLTRCFSKNRASFQLSLKLRPNYSKNRESNRWPEKSSLYQTLMTILTLNSRPCHLSPTMHKTQVSLWEVVSSQNDSEWATKRGSRSDTTFSWTTLTTTKL